MKLWIVLLAQNNTLHQLGNEMEQFPSRYKT